jgi:crotonobetainyl-CoA:carnitine CoA-transferase CaiB-like acyl-CoA transferase
LLGGLRVLDLGPGIAPSFCAKLLADYGAEVIKVESPGEGDPARRIGPFVGDDPSGEKSIPFLYVNTGKRGVTLDYSSDSGRAILRRLLDDADVLVEGFPPSENEESAIGYRELSRTHPRLVVTSVTPFGQEGPYRDFQATDIITCAMSGLMYHSGDSDKEPLRNALDQSLYVAGANAAAATLVAVFARLTSGEGQQVDVSVSECLAAHLVQPVPYYNYMGATKGRRPVRGSGFEELMPARDGYVVPSVQGSQPWETVADLIGLEELQDPRFASGAGRIANGEELKMLLIEGLAQWDRLPLFLASGERRLVFGMAQDAGDMVACPHLEARNFYHTVDHPVAGTATYPGMAAALSNWPQQAPAPAPLLGQHNAEIFGRELGIDSGELAALRYAGVI